MNQAHAPNRLLGLPWWLAYARFIGVDIHKHYVTVVTLDQQRQVLFQRRRIPLEQWPTWVEQHLTAQDAVIMEATTNCWWVYDQTAPVAGRCVVAHPDRKARVKTAPRGPPSRCQTLGRAAAGRRLQAGLGASPGSPRAAQPAGLSPAPGDGTGVPCGRGSRIVCRGCSIPPDCTLARGPCFSQSGAAGCWPASQGLALNNCCPLPLYPVPRSFGISGSTSVWEALLLL